MRTKEKSTKVYFVRHGQTDFPTNRIYSDAKEDPPLNRAGLIQAKAAALYFQDIAVDALYCSPAARTQRTAEEVSQVTGLSVIADERLRERDFGIWNGLYFSELEERHNDDYQAWKADPVYFTPQGGETIPDVCQRFELALDEMLLRHEGGTVVVVCHVGPIRLAVTQAFNIPLDMYRQIRVDYAAISRIDYGITKNNLNFLNIVRYKD